MVRIWMWYFASVPLLLHFYIYTPGAHIMHNYCECIPFSDLCTPLFRPPNCPEDLFSLMVECHRHRAEDRPSFTDILKILHTDDTEHTLDVSVQV